MLANDHVLLSTKAESEIPDSRIAIFMSAVLGSFAPQFLKWYSQAKIVLPDEKWSEFLGAMVAAGAFAVFAGCVAAFIWKENTSQRSFFIGLGLPYILWGALLDFQKAAVPKPTGAEVRQTIVQKQIGKPLGNLRIEVKRQTNVGLVALEEFRVEIKSAKSKQALKGPRTDPIPLLPGTYHLEAMAPGYFSQSSDVVIEAEKTTAVTVVLQKKSFADGFFDGFLSGVKGYSEPAEYVPKGR